MASVFRTTRLFLPFGVVIGKLIEGSNGLGSQLIVANPQFNPPLAWAALVFLSILGILLYLMVVIVEQVFMPWQKILMGR